jgi:ABC-type nickel/cobalt efflux system permease component RcnA
MGEAPVLSHYSLLRNHWTKQISVWDHCHEGETNGSFSILRGVSFWPHPKSGEGCQFSFLNSQFSFQVWPHNGQYLGSQEVLYLIPENSGNLLKLIHTHTHTHKHTHIHICTCRHIHAQTQTHVCMRTLWGTAEVSANYTICSPACLAWNRC